TPAASHTTGRRRGRASTAATRVASVTAASTEVSVRLPNSISSWPATAPVGTYEAAVQRGQVGQPSPEPVSRTAPPVTTIPTLATKLASASRRSRSGLTRGSSRTSRSSHSPPTPPASPSPRCSHWPAGGPAERIGLPAAPPLLLHRPLLLPGNRVLPEFSARWPRGKRRK